MGEITHGPEGAALFYLYLYLHLFRSRPLNSEVAFSVSGALCSQYHGSWKGGSGVVQDSHTVPDMRIKCATQ